MHEWKKFLLPVCTLIYVCTNAYINEWILLFIIVIIVSIVGLWMTHKYKINDSRTVKHEL